MLFEYTKLGGAEAQATRGINGYNSVIRGFLDVISDIEIWDTYPTSNSRGRNGFKPFGADETGPVTVSGAHFPVEGLAATGRTRAQMFQNVMMSQCGDVITGEAMFKADIRRACSIGQIGLEAVI